MSENIKISIVIPVYRAERIIDELCKRLKLHVSQISDRYEIILVDDCSPDNSWNKISENAKNDKRIKGYQLSRNFGQHNAITAGLDKCSGDWTVVMDCDLQDNPQEIIRLYNKAIEGYDIVYASRNNRKDPLLKKMSSVLFYKIFSYLSGHKQDGTVANFGIYNRKVIDAINTMREPLRIFSASVRWTGFNSTSIKVNHDERFIGKSSYSWKSLISFALDYALSYSQKPLTLTIKLGFSITLISFICSLYYIISHFNGKIQQPGFTSLIISIWFLSGLIIFILGIVGIYVGETFRGTKNRPIYIIRDSIYYKPKNRNNE
jgi:polyisoprenyl-phosphate glycosyltransferase